jgi:CRISPR-associated protein Cmr2
VRDEGDRRSALLRVNLPNEPWFSDVLARKRIVGQIVKRQGAPGQQWYQNSAFSWQSQQGTTRWNPELQGQPLLNWVQRFEEFLQRSDRAAAYYGDLPASEVQPARTLRNIGSTSAGFVAYIYADGNNVGGYIQKIRTALDYQAFSNDVSIATEYAVYLALAQHLRPRYIDADPDSGFDQAARIHPFEIVTIGGDDVLLIVPADKALEITQTIGESFEKILLREIVVVSDVTIARNYQVESAQSIADPNQIHRYQHQEHPAPNSHCQLSLSAGVLITALNTPIYYAEKLVNQLLKSAKQKARSLENYHGGTVDFLVMKAVTMLSSKISEFRDQGLLKVRDSHRLKLYAAPYTLHELSGLIRTVQALKRVEFPRSQLYQIRSFLEQGRRTAILNYRYFRVRLAQGAELQQQFEQAWCSATTNNGNLAPWMYVQSANQPTYETIWYELVDLYPFVGEDLSALTQLPEFLEAQQ